MPLEGPNISQSNMLDIHIMQHSIQLSSNFVFSAEDDAIDATFLLTNHGSLLFLLLHLGQITNRTAASLEIGKEISREQPGSPTLPVLLLFL